MIAAAVAFVTWGTYPVFFRQLAAIAPDQILAWRVVFSCIILAAAFALSSRLTVPWHALRQPRTVFAIMAATLLLSTNWYVFIYAVNNGHILEASLGYFLNPMIVGLAGIAVFGERLHFLKNLSIAVALFGLALTFMVAGVVPLLSVIIAVSFASYAIIRKTSPLDSSSGLFLETLVMVPVALWWLWRTPVPAVTYEPATLFWLVCSGVMTLVPLLCAVYAAQRIALSTFGLFQYIAPSMHLGFAVLVYGERMDLARGLAFATTLTAVALFIAGALSTRHALANQPAQAPERLST